MKKLKVGWIGLGNMGTPMALNLLKAGFQLSVYNRTENKTASLVEKGANRAASIQDLVDSSDIIISMVSDDAAVMSVYDGDGGLLSCKGLDGKIAIDMSTVSPDTSKLLAEKAAGVGLGYLDAPVSGSVKPAQDGQLVILVGGEKCLYDVALPVFDCLGKVSLHLGSTGAGNNAKLAINLMLAFYFEGMAEMVCFANKKGISTDLMMSILNEGAMGCSISRIKTNNLVNDDYTAAFALKHLAKDLRLAKEQGLSSNAGLAIEQNYRTATSQGFGDLDSSGIIELVRKMYL